MKYQIILQYGDPGVPERRSIIERDSDDEARDAAKRWANLVRNASGPHDPKPLVWFLCRLGVDDMFTAFDADKASPERT